MVLTTAGALGVGYQGQDGPGFVDDLLAHGIEHVFDIRLTPISRKKGFSKRALAAQLLNSEIGYDHLPVLGNPKWNRQGFAGSPDELAEACHNYAARLRTEEAQAALDHIREASARQRVAVLCFESDGQRCHRKVVLDALTRGG
jgi:uncharacterized protein (DUF488 family)